jgi:cytosine/adenosine deaminase-related metal-dependent hydrolase
MDAKRREFMRNAGFAGLAFGGVSAGILGSGSAVAAGAPPKRGRILLRGGYVVTMDPQLGELRGDVLIDNGRIGAVGPGLSASGADVVDASDMIVLPGFIDTHRHTWQSVVRQMSVDIPLGDYIRLYFGKFGVNFRPQDVYAGLLLGRLAALESGITTLLAWEHIMNSPEHADAAVEALRDAGVRSVFAMGWPQLPNPGVWLNASTRELPDDIARVRKQYFSSNTGLVTLQMANRGPTFATMDQVAKDILIARQLDIQTTMHISGGAAELQKRGLLGPDLCFVHLLGATEEELRMIHDSGVTTSISVPGEEWHTGWKGRSPATMRLLRAGLLPSLSADTEAFAPGDMFSTMKGTLGQARFDVANPEAGVPAPENPREFNGGTVIPARKVLEMATFGGAAATGNKGTVGMLTPGNHADVVCLKASHLNHYPVNDAIGTIVMAADTASVEAVFVAGKAVKFNGQLVNRALVAKARKLALESRDYLFSKAGMAKPS